LHLVRILKLLGVAFLFGGAAMYVASGGIEEDPITAFSGLSSMIAGLLVYFRGRQHAARSRAAGILTDARPDVVYLRAFRADPSSLHRRLMQSLATDEEQLADALRPFGDLVAIGRPGESLPLPGAARMYASDAEWQNAVMARIAVAPLVVIRAGVGAGLFWELQHTFRNVDPCRIIIWILDVRQTDYETFRTQVGSSFAITLPSVPILSVLEPFSRHDGPSRVRPGFIRFSSDWSPIFLPLPPIWIQLGYNDSRGAFRSALRPLFEEHRVAWRPLGRFS